MGYCTNYNLDVHQGDKAIYEILQSIAEKEFDGLWYAVDENGETTDSCKWYNHEEDMRNLSKKFPNIVFRLHGEGEESGDVWYKYFKNGKMQDCYAKITYDDYDESQLR